ncbi:MAG: OsmC family protein, partial [Gemmatimonadota bacterium]|nr:OsmC family protein [Gemmatimonadota bacterium]
MLKTRVKWVEGLQFVGTADSNRAVVMDGSAKGGGAESAVRPKELLLLSLAGCTGMDVVSIMKKMRLDVRSFEVRVEGEDAQNHPKAFKKIKLSYLVAGKELPEDKVRK